MTRAERRYRRTAKWKAVCARYNQSEKHRIIARRYKKSAKGKAARRRYESTEKYKIVYLRYRNKPGVRSYYCLAQKSRNTAKRIAEQKI